MLPGVAAAVVERVEIVPALKVPAALAGLGGAGDTSAAT